MTKLFPSKQLSILITIIVLIYTSSSAQESKLDSLIHIIENASKYDAKKKAEIDSIRSILEGSKKPSASLYIPDDTQISARFILAVAKNDLSCNCCASVLL